MSQQFFKLLRVGFLPLLFVFTGCGGSDSTTPIGSLTDPDIYLTSLDVTGYDIGFSADRTGPYNLQVPNAVTSLTLSATANRSGLSVYTRQTSTLLVQVTPWVVIASGATHQYQLAEGTNLIDVRIGDDAAFLSTTYTLKVDRVSTTATLAGASFGNLLAAPTESPSFAFNETFDVTLFDYSVDVPYQNCSTYFQPYTNNASTQLSVTTPLATVSDARSSSPIYFDLQTGANQVTAELTSEDGLNTTTYNFTLNRAAGTAAQIAANANLASLSLSPAEFTFFCGNTTYSTLRVNNDVTSVQLIAQPEDPAAAILVDGVSYTAGSTLDVTLDTDGGSLIDIQVTSADGQNTLNYLMAITNSPRNVVKVSTAEELQAALLNAQPNQEIQVAPGTYTGVASVATSGSDTAHFFSSQSGTVDNPIYLVSQSIYSESILSGSGTAQNTVLELSGDYWVVVGLQFKNAYNGIVLDAANNNTLRNFDINNTGAQALIMRNGSSNNAVASARFSNTGIGLAPTETGNAEAVLIGSDDALWQSNPNVAGPYLEVDNNNAIRSSIFASSIAAEAIEINEGAVGTIVEFNTFESGSLTAQADDTSMLKVQGNDSIIRYNTFYHQNDINLEEVIAIDDASETWHTVDWGENTKIYQNEFLLSGANVPVVNANSSATYVTENIRESGATVSYVGTGIDQSTLNAPSYQIRAASDESLCLATGSYSGSTSTTTIGRAETCVDGDLTMQWKFITEGEGYVRIQSAANPDLYLYPISTFVSGCDSTNLTRSMLRIREIGLEGLIYSWKVLYQAQDAVLVNKSNENFLMMALSDENQSLQAGEPILMCRSSSSVFQRFKIVEQ